MYAHLKVCVLLGTRGSIRGSGRVAQMQVIEGKKWEALLDGGGSLVVTSFTHACWHEFSQHACLDTYGICVPS